MASYRPARSRWLSGDVDHLIARWREPEATGRDRIRAVLRWLQGFGPRYPEEVFRWRDPRPFLHETRSWLRHVSTVGRSRDQG